MSGGSVPKLALDCDEAAQSWSISTEHFLRLVEAKIAPEPVKLGRRSVWSVRALAVKLDQLAGLEPAEPTHQTDAADDPIMESIRAKRTAAAR